MYWYTFLILFALILTELNVLIAHQKQNKLHWKQFTVVFFF